MACPVSKVFGKPCKAAGEGGFGDEAEGKGLAGGLVGLEPLQRRPSGCDTLCEAVLGIGSELFLRTL